MRYRRTFIPGGSFFFTVVTEQRRPVLASAEAVEVLRMAFRAVRSTRPFEVDAMVVLPDHLYCIWTLPPNDGDFATRWRLVKTWFTKHCDPALRTAPDRARTAKGEQALWQYRYWEHLLRDEADFNRHVEYIQRGIPFAPVDTRYGACSMTLERIRLQATGAKGIPRYIHFNPVKHGHAQAPMDWPYSSFRRYVEADIYPADWGQGEMRFEGVGHA